MKAKSLERWVYAGWAGPKEQETYHPVLLQLDLESPLVSSRVWPT